MLRMYFLQQWYALADEAPEYPLDDSPAFRHFVGVALGRESVSHATTLLGLRQLIEENGLTEAIFKPGNAGLRAQGLLLAKKHPLA